MLKAIHKDTGELVSAFKLSQDIFWKEKQKEIFIAPFPEIRNWEELKLKYNTQEVDVSFVKRHTRKRNDQNETVREHFRINNDKALPSYLSESDEHKTAKEGIYYAILSNELKITGIPILDFYPIEDIDMEFRLSPSKITTIADVIVKFKEEHIHYGRGVVFEIQFSNQNQEKTEERTYKRVLERYSVCWLWKNDFINNKLKNQEVNIIPYFEEINNKKKKEIEGFNKDINSLKEIINHSIKNSNQKIDSFYELANEKIREAKEYLNQVVDRNDKILNNQKESFKAFLDHQTNLFNEKIKQNIQNYKEDLIESQKEFTSFINKSVSVLQEDKGLHESIIKSINLNKLTEEVSKTLSGKVNQLVFENILKVIGKETFESKILAQVKEGVFPEIKEKLGLIKGEMMMKCPRCLKIKRLNSVSIDKEEGILCYDCANTLKIIRNQAWFKREGKNGITKNNKI